MILIIRDHSFLYVKFRNTSTLFRIDLTLFRECREFYLSDSNTQQTYHGSVCKTVTKVSMTDIQILPRSYWEKNILFPVTAGKNGIVPFFSYNVTRVSRKVH